MLSRRKRVLLEELLEIVLASVNPSLVRDEVGWELARLIHARKLYTERGYRAVLKAARRCEPEKTEKILRRYRRVGRR
ncbi:MAG: hypothetical protein NXY59_10355 [Aigarchaeota archaeon]|nr:hypothetical protein [Candidatus Pelearchaeum maunauluense]